MYTLILPNAAHMTEFVGGLNGDCVETAMAVACGIARGAPANAESILAIVHSMQAEGISSANGETTINAAHDWLVQQGYAIVAYVPYAEQFGGDWLALLRQHAGYHPIVLNVANGQALVDVETGIADEPRLHYHGLAVVGRQEDGYICADGDNHEVMDRFQIYPASTIEAAQPCGMIVLGMNAHPIALPASGGTAIPDGWHDDGETLTAPNGVPVIHGFRDWVLSHAWNPDDWPLVPEYHTEDVGNDGTHGGGAQQEFRYSALGWTPASKDPFPLWIGSMWRQSQDRLAAAQQQIATLKQQITTMPQATAPLTTQQEADLAAMAALRKAVLSH